jgi:hypothetical protein
MSNQVSDCNTCIRKEIGSTINHANDTEREYGQPKVMSAGADMVLRRIMIMKPNS